MVNVTVNVLCGAMLTTPACGMIHGTSETRMPVSVASPSLVKTTEPPPG